MTSAMTGGELGARTGSLASLSPAEQEVLAAVLLRPGSTYRDAAARLGLAPDVVLRLLRSALQQVRTASMAAATPWAATRPPHGELVSG